MLKVCVDYGSGRFGGLLGSKIQVPSFRPTPLGTRIYEGPVVSQHKLETRMCVCVCVRGCVGGWVHVRVPMSGGERLHRLRVAARGRAGLHGARGPRHAPHLSGALGVGTLSWKGSSTVFALSSFHKCAVCLPVVISPRHLRSGHPWPSRLLSAKPKNLLPKSAPSAARCRRESVRRRSRSAAVPARHLQTAQDLGPGGGHSGRGLARVRVPSARPILPKPPRQDPLK